MYRAICGRQMARCLITSGKPMLMGMRNSHLYSCPDSVLQTLSQAIGICNDIDRLYPIAAQNESLQSSLLDLVYKAHSLDEELEETLKTTREELKYRIVETPTSNKLQLDPVNFVPYSSSSYALSKLLFVTFWNMHWCTRTKIQQAILKCLPLFTAHDLSPTLPAESTLRATTLEMVDHICAIGPFILGKLDTEGTLHPTAKGKSFGAFQYLLCLCVAGSVAYIPNTQFDWIRMQMLHIGNVVGIRQALGMYSRLGSSRAEAIRRTRDAGLSNCPSNGCSEKDAEATIS